VLHSSVVREKSERALVDGAKGGDEAAFRELIEPLARELGAYAYRMLGAFQDAEDALQETRIKAWRHLATYEHSHPEQPSFRAWVYRIATNTCLDMLRKEKRRVLPQDVGSSVEPGPPATEMRSDIDWLEPYPDALLPVAADPEATLRLHDSVRLALVRAMQLLPARQRAALVLHDVLDFGVDEIATMLETTTAAINSALQRARATLERTPVHVERGATAPERREAQKADAIARFVHAWETGNMDGVVAMLTHDAVMNMPPWIYWLDGRDAIVATVTGSGTWQGAPRPGRYRIVPTSLNGQPAGLAYVRMDDGRWVSVCMTVMTLAEDGRVSAMDVFVLPQQFAAWGHPAELE
jgi:RNA polymerase sigma-70 factor (ECF subfamily)